MFLFSTKTLTGQLRLAKAGKPVAEEEIPPPVALGASHSVNKQPEQSMPQTQSSKLIIIYFHNSFQIQDTCYF